MKIFNATFPCRVPQALMQFIFLLILHPFAVQHWYCDKRLDYSEKGKKKSSLIGIGGNFKTTKFLRTKLKEIIKRQRNNKKPSFLVQFPLVNASTYIREHRYAGCSHWFTQAL